MNKALDAGLKHPLESKLGLALIAEARIALALRPLLKADDYAGVLAFLKVQPSASKEQTAEVRNAWSELTDLCEARLATTPSTIFRAWRPGWCRKNGASSRATS